VIARKVIRLAVDRNRLRRRLREAVRAARPALERYDVVFRVRTVVPRESIVAAAAEGRDLVIRLVEREKKNDMEPLG
jgi:ribonuclease P protein component